VLERALLVEETELKKKLRIAKVRLPQGATVKRACGILATKKTIQKKMSLKRSEKEFAQLGATLDKITGGREPKWTKLWYRTSKVGETSSGFRQGRLGPVPAANTDPGFQRSSKKKNENRTSTYAVQGFRGDRRL